MAKMAKAAEIEAPVAADALMAVAESASLEHTLLAGFSGRKRAAILLVTMGSEFAAKLYKYLKPDEIEQLTLEIATLPHINSETMNEALSEFYEMCLAQKFIVEGGMEYAQEILEQAFGVANAKDIVEKVLSSIGTKSFDFMKKVDPKQLFTFIQHEYPQTIALILSYATRMQASTIISMLPQSKQVEVVRRIATMDRTSPAIVKEIEDNLRTRLATLGTKEIAEDLGGVKYTADLLNNVDRTTEKFIFDELGKEDPDLAADIRKLMFVFEDIVNLDDYAMQKLVGSIDPKELIIALKSANDEIQTAFFSNMSKRSAEMVKEDMQYARNVRPKDVEEAQARIVSKIRELGERRHRNISRGG